VNEAFLRLDCHFVILVFERGGSVVFDWWVSAGPMDCYVMGCEVT
jgi:hypothetical protein